MPGGVVALGEPATVRGLALAGVRVIPAETPAQVRRAWATLVATGPLSAACSPPGVGTSVPMT